MDFESYIKMQEPVLTEDELYERRFESQLDLFESEEADIKTADTWIRSFELDEDEINKRYEESLRRY